MNNNYLPEFQEYLARRKMAPENQIPFYARWTGRFLRFSNAHQDKPVDLRIEMFLDALKKDKKLQEWQVVQADNAVRLYIHHFLSEAGNISQLFPNAGTAAEKRFHDAKTMQGKIRETLRIKHYAYSTERTYIDVCATKKTENLSQQRVTLSPKFEKEGVTWKRVVSLIRSGSW